MALGLYLALLLAPLAAAAGPVEGGPRGYSAELAAGLGFVAFTTLALEFALVSRLRAATEPFGMDALQLFHRKMGVAALGLAWLHAGALVARERDLELLDPLRGPVGIRSGALALWATLALVASSLWRRRLALPHEAWQWVHRVMAPLAMGASLLHVLSVGHHAARPPVRGLCIGYAALFGAMFLRQHALRPWRAWRRPWKLVSVRDEGGDTLTLHACPEGHGGLAFEPGQFVWVATGRTPFSAGWHPITISSSARRAPTDPLELSIKGLGDWSRTRVPSLLPGARLWIDGPYGAFSPDRVPAQGFVLIAGGIGITPMRSMLLTLRDRGDRRPVLLVHAAHDLGRAVFVEELESLRATLALRIVLVLEAPDPDWRGEEGYITADLLRRNLPAELELQQFFVCGPGPMMDALETILAEIGVPPHRVHTERFDMV